MTTARQMRFTHLESPVGRLLVAGDAASLRLIAFESVENPPRPANDWLEDPGSLADAVRQLEAYFAGRLRHFDLTLAPQGTPFQLAVWRGLESIPYGQTISYGELACRIGKPTAVRAVGAANGANPLPIVLPCHRVIGADGSLTGYGGGISIKERLLSLEGARLDLTTG